MSRASKVAQSSVSSASTTPSDAKPVLLEEKSPGVKQSIPASSTASSPAKRKPDQRFEGGVLKKARVVPPITVRKALDIWQRNGRPAGFAEGLVTLKIAALPDRWTADKCGHANCTDTHLVRLKH